MSDTPEVAEAEIVEDEDEAVGSAVAVRADAPVNLFHTDDPAAVIEKATAHATALADVVRQRDLMVRIQNSEHVRVEGWTLLGSMLGVFPVTVWTRRIDDGWEARVEARTLVGQVVGAAEAQCDRSEKTWKNRDDYALRSMAQTRATSKALRHPLGFVIQLAGFNPTPAEEVPPPPPSRSESSPRGGRAQAPPRGAQPQPPPEADTREPTPAQLAKFHALLNEHDIDDAAKRRLLAKYGENVTSSKHLTRSQMTAFIDVLVENPDHVKRAAAAEIGE